MINTKEAIEEILTEYGVTFTDALADRLMMAIEALSRSENPNKWIGAEVLDKIRAEIVGISPKTYPFTDHMDDYVKTNDVLRIIDKYKAERSNKE